MFRRAAADIGFELVLAGPWPETEDLLLRSGFDRIFFSLELWKKAPPGFFRKLRASGVTTPVTIMSRNRSAQVYLSLLRQGVEEVLFKPFCQDVIVRSVLQDAREGFEDPTSKVLVVDDFPQMLDLSSEILGMIGYTQVLEAKSGELAMEVLKADPSFGLVMSDWNMPGMTGLEFLRELRGSAGIEHLPFMMVTAEADLEFIKSGIQSGVDAYVVKPFNASVLEQKLRRLLAARAQKLKAAG